MSLSQQGREWSGTQFGEDNAYFGPLRLHYPAKIGKSSTTTSEALSNDAKFSYNSNLEAILNKIQKEKKRKRKFIFGVHILSLVQERLIAQVHHVSEDRTGMTIKNYILNSA